MGMELATLATIATIGSAVVGAGGSLIAGQNAKQAGDWEAAQLKRKAAEETAAGQRGALEKRADADKVMSRQVALAAASGAGTATPTVLDLVEEAAGRGEFFAQGEMYGAKSRAAGMKDQAKAAKMKGQMAESASYLSAFGDLLGGVGSAVGKYNPKGGVSYG
jgi:hypothetical protein